MKLKCTRAVKYIDGHELIVGRVGKTSDISVAWSGVTVTGTFHQGIGYPMEEAIAKARVAIARMLGELPSDAPAHDIVDMLDYLGVYGARR
jgi:hypothetical protein